MIAKFIDGLYVENTNVPPEFDWVEEFTCVISERVGGEYLYHSSIQNLKKHHWFCFNRAFFWDAKIQWFCFVPERGMVLVEEVTFDASQRTVRIDLETDSFHEVQLWVDVCQEFKNKHNCNLIIGVKDSLITRISESRKSFTFVDSCSQCEDFVYAKYTVGRFERPDHIENFDHNPGWFTQNWWRYYRSDKNPSLFQYQHSEDIARDILGLKLNGGFSRESLDVEYFVRYSMTNIVSTD